MVVVDLGCSSGPNTLLFISELISMIAQYCKNTGLPCDQRQLQFFLNYLPGNDFNNLFKLVEHFNQVKGKKSPGREAPPPCYISGSPGSYYTRVFPCQSVHLFHSLFSLHWRSQACFTICALRTHVSMHFRWHNQAVGNSTMVCPQKNF